MSQQVHITYYGMDGSGRNLTAAKQDAGRKIEAALTGNYNPELLSCRGMSILVFRQPSGWDHVITALSNNPREGTLYAGGNYPTRQDAVNAAKNHLAQLAWECEDGVNPPIELDRNETREFKTWATFQLRYQNGLSNGLSKDDAHAYAGKDPCRPELWMSEAATAENVWEPWQG